MPRATPTKITKRARSTDDSPKLLIAIPFYRAEHVVAPIIASLIQCKGDILALNAEVILFNDSPDYEPLSKALAAAEAKIAGQFSVKIQTNPQNLGWVKTANLAMQAAIDHKLDLVLLNSDTVIFPGALPEMVRIADLDPMIGFVNPRSNNATLASFPVGQRFTTLDPEPAYSAFQALGTTLPELSYVPTAVGFAVLIRHRVLAEFGGFDEVYGRGYNEENDLVMRASRCGYRAVLANRAFVWHAGEQSFGGESDQKTTAERAHRAILDARYPEYGGLVANWDHGVEHRAEILISTLLPDENGRLKIAFDFSDFGQVHSGTQKAGVQLAKAAAETWTDQYDVYVLCEEESYVFHGLDKVDVRRDSPHTTEAYAAVFRVGQPFYWDVLRRLSLQGAVVGIFMLDTIALDCGHLTSPALYDLWQATIDHCDFLIFNSNFTKRQFELRFQYVNRRPNSVSLHSLDLEDYRSLDQVTALNFPSDEVNEIKPEYILIVGNHYPHKHVSATANTIALERPDLEIVALGSVVRSHSNHKKPEPFGLRNESLIDYANLSGFAAGGLSDADITALYLKSRLVVMPSHYEGFGIPLLMALAHKRPFIARSIPALREVYEELGHNPNVYFYDTTTDLLEILKTPPSWIETDIANPKLGDAKRAAADIRAAIDKALSQSSYEIILNRFRMIHTHFSFFRQEPQSDGAGFAARFVAIQVERVVVALLRLPFILPIAKATYHFGRRLVGAITRALKSLIPGRP